MIRFELQQPPISIAGEDADKVFATFAELVRHEAERGADVVLADISSDGDEPSAHTDLRERLLTLRQEVGTRLAGHGLPDATGESLARTEQESLSDRDALLEYLRDLGSKHRVAVAWDRGNGG